MIERDINRGPKLTIDKHRLDQEWVEQPNEFYIWSTKSADAQFEYDQAKADLSILYAELDKLIRDDPASFGVGKLSEEVVKQTVNNQKEYQAGVKRVNTARHKLSVCQAAVQALEHRKRALTLLVELWIKEYYAEARAPRTESPEAAEFEKEAVRRRAIRRAEDQNEDSEVDDV